MAQTRMCCKLLNKYHLSMKTLTDENDPDYE